MYYILGSCRIVYVLSDPIFIFIQRVVTDQVPEIGFSGTWIEPKNGFLAGWLDSGGEFISFVLKKRRTTTFVRHRPTGAIF